MQVALSTFSLSLAAEADEAETTSPQPKRRKIRGPSPAPSNFTASSAVTVNSSDNLSHSGSTPSRSATPVKADRAVGGSASPTTPGTRVASAQPGSVPSPAPAAPELVRTSSGAALDRPSRSTRNTTISYAIQPLDPIEPKTRAKSSKPAKGPAKPKGKAANWNDEAVYKKYPAAQLEAEDGVTYALQTSTCFGPKYGKHPQCHMCVNRQGGNICLFRWVRSFPVNPTDPTHKPIGPPAFLNSTTPDDPPQFPVEFNEPFTVHHAEQIKTVAAWALVPTLEKELAHASLPNTRRIKLGIAERSLCDTCLHAMFGGKFQCYLCAREQCLDCHARLKQIHAQAHQAGVSLGQFAFDNKANEDLRRLTKCSGRGGENPVHSPDSFIGLTRFTTSNLSRWVGKMTAWKVAHPIPPPPPLDDAQVAAYYSAGRSNDGNQDYLAVPLAEIDPFPTALSATDQAVPLGPPSDPPPPTSRPTKGQLVAAADTFHGLWSKGETMVVNVGPAGVDYQEWTPAKLAATVAEVECIVASNRTGIERNSTVGTFFGNFGKGNASGQSLKIKVSRAWLGLLRYR